MGDKYHRPPMRRGMGTSVNVISEIEVSDGIPEDYQCPHCKAHAPKNLKKCKECNKDILGR